ncbi:MAG: hypothetical protein ACU837_11140 [Gammaproteobacteria bacterium]
MDIKAPGGRALDWNETLVLFSFYTNTRKETVTLHNYIYMCFLLPNLGLAAPGCSESSFSMRFCKSPT